VAFADELRDAQSYWVEIEVDGWGRRLNADVAGRQYAYRFATIDAGYFGNPLLPTDAYIQAVPEDGLPPAIGETIDLREGKTSLGSLTWSACDSPASLVTYSTKPHGWAGHTTITSPPGEVVITDLLAVEGPGLAGPWTLSADVATKAQAVWSLTSVAGLSVGVALWIGAETVTVSKVDAANSTITVSRGAYNSPAQVHRTTTSYPPGEGTLYDRPRYVRGRRVRVYLNAFASANFPTGRLDMSPVGSARMTANDDGTRRLVWQGVIDDWELTDMDRFQFACKPALGELDQSIGRAQFNGMVPKEIASSETVTDNRALSLPDVWIPFDGYGSPIEPDQEGVSLVVPSGATRTYKDFHARIGKGIAVVNYNRGTADPRGSGGYFVRAGDWGLLKTEGGGGGKKGAPLREVLITSRRPTERIGNHDRAIGPPGAIGEIGHLTYTTTANHNAGIRPPSWFYFKDSPAAPGGVDGPSANPVDVMLALVTSTGGGTNGAWDVLPAHWGAGFDYSRINVGSFLEVRRVFAGVAFDGLVLGWKGEPIPLRGWLEKQILKPLGWFLYLDENSALALGMMRDVFPGEVLPTITEDDIAVDDDGGGRVRMLGNLPATLSFQTWKWGYDFNDKEPAKVHRYRHAEALERNADDDSEMTFEVLGLSEADDAIGAAANRIARWWTVPTPKVEIAVGLHKIAQAITSHVALTISTLPNPFTGGRGFVDQPCIVVGRTLNLQRGDITLELVLLPSRNLGRWCPSGQVAAADVGAGQILTFEANEFSPGLVNGGPGDVPERDAAGFVVGDRVMLLDSDLQILTNNVARTVTAVESAGIGNNKIKVDGPFLDGAGNEIARAAGMIVTYCNWEKGDAPQAEWTDSMKRQVAQGDEATGDLPDGSPSYVYGM